MKISGDQNDEALISLERLVRSKGQYRWPYDRMEYDDQDEEIRRAMDVLGVRELRD